MQGVIVLSVVIAYELVRRYRHHRAASVTSDAQLAAGAAELAEAAA